MSLGEVQVSTRGERRRSERSPLGLPLAIRGVALDTKPFHEDTFTLSVSAHGALVALATTVTLGQTLVLRNPRTQDETQVCVTRFGPTRGTWNQVGIEFAQPNPDFWSPEPQAAPPNGNDQLTEHSPDQPPDHSPDEPSQREAQISPNPGEDFVAASAAPNGGKGAPQAGAPMETTLPGIFLRSLEQTLQQAAEHVVAAASTARLNAAVNQAAESIENFSRGRMRVFEARLVQYQQDLLTSIHEEFQSRIKADIAQTEEHLRRRAAELLEEAAREAHNGFVERLREEASRVAAQFGEEVAGSAAQRLASFSDETQATVNEARSQVQTAANEARSQMDQAAAALHESQEKISGEADRAVTETQQKIESLTSQSKEVYADWDVRLQAFREDLTRAAEQEIARFRGRLQSGLSSLFSSLG